MSSKGVIEPTGSRAAREHIASPDAGSTAQQPIGTDDQAALEFNVSSKPLLTRSWRSAATPPNHRATQEYPLPTTTGHDSEF
ncbi:hypothetical protein K503DRAFT_777307 [Rhizopogon vinicolor AM-OR11-026]|uniref:Uncharacterized protein n=1 Tax=Rhizopogon vinicolor AM-OR11-026 TaxID=1314800 RepID=A0A1B7MGP7_9AGAM|nr:hypothetical protein K503DRAFT_777307 [Rhizopogon vinicolor AM-OR11-026]